MIRRSFGFTIVEILVVISILSIMGIIFVEIFSRSLKGANQAQLLGVIKQNGQSALETMDKNIRLASGVVCIVSSGAQEGKDTIVVRKEGGTFIRYKFNPSTPGKNGFISEDETDDCYTPLLTSNLRYLTNTDPKNGVSLIFGSFNQNTKAGFSDIITISFTLGPGADIPTTLTNNVEAQNFNTTIQLR
jgi:type II secretory pathway pseudopilin PulG